MNIFQWIAMGIIVISTVVFFVWVALLTLKR